jgi:hypothetical protein
MKKSLPTLLEDLDLVKEYPSLNSNPSFKIVTSCLFLV